MAMESPPTEDAKPEPTSGESPRAGLPRWAWIAGAAVLLVVVVGVIAGAASSSSEATYDDAVRDRFLSACTEDGGDPVRSTCECIYAKVEAEIPFDRFEEIDAQLAEQAGAREPGAPLELPSDIEAIRVACVTSTS
jgi:hypothetical protein